MAKKESILTYLKLDYETHRDALLDRVRSRWSASWNDFLASNIGVLFVDLVAWSTATVAYVLNRVAGENFVSTMTLRESAVRLGSLTNYKLRGATAATLAAETRLAAPNGAVGDTTKDVIVPKGTSVRVTGRSDVVFEILDDYVIPSGYLTPRLPVVYISGDISETDTLETNVSVTQGQPYVDLLNSSYNLKEYASVGQTFQELDSSNQPTGNAYKINGITSSPGATSKNRLVLDRGWEGLTGTTAGWVYDTRMFLVEGQTFSERFSSPSTSAPRLRLELSRTPVIDNSVRVEVDGFAWSEVQSLAVQNAEAEVYEIKRSDDGTTYVVFGNAVFGSQVPPEAAIEVTYRIGGGTRGNIAAGSVSTSVTGTERATGRPVTVNVNNAGNTGSGGSNEETLEEARVNIPAYTRTNDRAVTLEDYRTLATSFNSDRGSVRYARASTRIQNALLEGNVVIIYAWTVGESGNLVPVPFDVKNALEAFLRSKAVGTDHVLVADGTALPLPVSLRYKLLPGFDLLQVEESVRTVIQNVVNGLIPGEAVVYSDFISNLDGVQGVDSVTFATPIADISPSNQNEIYSPPTEDYLYEVALQSVSGINKYTAQSPVTPLAVWSFRVYLDEVELTVVPDVEQGYARLLGENIPDVLSGTLAERPTVDARLLGSYYLATDVGAQGTLYFARGINDWAESSNSNDVARSRVDLRTGEIALNTKSSVGTLEMSLNTLSYYDRTREVNIYVGYRATDTSQQKRREVRQQIRATMAQMRVGQTLFGSSVSGLQQSKFNIKDVVRAVSAVTSVERVALDTPNNNSVRVDASDTELLVPGQIILNNSAD